jgi:hypothetical protein
MVVCVYIHRELVMEVKEDEACDGMVIVGLRSMEKNPVRWSLLSVQRAFVKASEEAESARMDKEREQLKTTVRQQRRIAWLLGGVAVLMGGGVLGLIAWINQSYLKEQIDWFTQGLPYRREHFDKCVRTAEAERALNAGDSFKECDRACPEPSCRRASS